MLRTCTLLVILLASSAFSQQSKEVNVSAIDFAAEFIGTDAFEHARYAINLGPRPSGSEANRQLQTYILGKLKTCKCEVTEDAFTARTPRGEIAMKNIIAKFPGRARAGAANAIVVTGHFDTKYFPGRKFVGANDGGSSTGLLLELAAKSVNVSRVNDLYIVFFDGEEAVGDWSDTDKLYGSRHLAQKWKADGTLARIKGLINVDMIGDRTLTVRQDTNSNPKLRELIWRAAAEMGYLGFFIQAPITIDDDHMPFVELGVPAVDLIDFDYEPWHEDTDTLDKIGPLSLQVVGRVVMESIKRLERQ